VNNPSEVKRPYPLQQQAQESEKQKQQATSYAFVHVLLRVLQAAA
jgi:hypothetical protein